MQIRPLGVPSASDPELSRFEASEPGDINGYPDPPDCIIPKLCRHGRVYGTRLDESMVCYPSRLLFDCDTMKANPPFERICHGPIEWVSDRVTRLIE
jgi:hypothetical protein